MDLGYNGLTTRHTTLQEDIFESVKYGFKAIELRDYKIEAFLKDFSLNDLDKMLGSAEARPIAINSIEINEEAFHNSEKLLDKFTWMLNIAKIIKCPYIVVAPMNNLNNTSSKRIRQGLVKIFREMSDVCNQDNNIKIGLEYIGSPSAMIKTLDEALELLSAIKKDNIGLVIDTFAFYANHSRASDIRRIKPDDLLLVHLNDSNAVRGDAGLEESNRIFPGEGVILFDEIIPEFLKIGYDGVYSIELINPDIWTWDPSEVFRKSYASLQTLLSAYY